MAGMNLSNWLPRSPLKQGVLTLAGGTGLAQMLAIGISPVLSRLYSPADYGVYFVVSALSGLLVFLVTVRYELAIPLPEGAVEARQLAAIAAGLGFLLSGVAALGCHHWRQPIFALFGAPGAGGFWWAIPVTVLAQAAYQIGYHWALRTKSYRVLAATRLWQSLSSAAVGLVVGWLVGGPLGLLLGLVLAQAAGGWRLWRHLLARDHEETGRKRRTRLEKVATTARRHAAFAVSGALAGFLNASGTLLPPLLVAGLYGPDPAGWMGFAVRLISLPMQVVGTAISQVFLAEAAALMRRQPEAVAALVGRITRRTLKFAGLILLGGALSPLVFPWLFGESWREAGRLAAWLSLPAAAQVVVSPVSNLAVLMKRQGIQLALDAARAIVVVLSLSLPWRFGASPQTAVATFSTATLTMYAVYFAAYMALARRLRGPTEGAATPSGPVV
ncbi:MAG: oligosaccharide flippase family protein [Verrucomicrobiales bacterium]|nr:oligosaccharide flippase family protein [Verrucomicrobiales bacterium]